MSLALAVSGAAAPVVLDIEPSAALPFTGCADVATPATAALVEAVGAWAPVVSMAWCERPAVSGATTGERDLEREWRRDRCLLLRFFTFSRFKLRCGLDERERERECEWWRRSFLRSRFSRVSRRLERSRSRPPRRSERERERDWRSDKSLERERERWLRRWWRRDFLRSSREALLLRERLRLRLRPRRRLRLLSPMTTAQVALTSVSKRSTNCVRARAQLDIRDDVTSQEAQHDELTRTRVRDEVRAMSRQMIVCLPRSHTRFAAAIASSQLKNSFISLSQNPGWSKSCAWFLHYNCSTGAK